MRSEFQTYNDADVINAQFGNAALEKQSALVPQGSVTLSGLTLTTPLGTASGGTGATSASGARSNLGIDAIATCKSNLAATVAPTINDDAGDGYAVGSFWLGTVLGAAYICLDATVGAAAWSKITP